MVRHICASCFWIIRYTDRLTLCCSVSSYSVSSGTLELKHCTSSDVNVTVFVDVRLVLEKLSVEQTRAGEWVNVIGYITLIPKAADGKNASSNQPEVHVQALLLWLAGPLDIQQYQLSIEHPAMAQ